MVRVEIDGRELAVTISGLDSFWAIKRSLRVPLAHVAGARVDAMAGSPGWKMFGTGIPRGLAAGRFRKGGEYAFWVARQRHKALVVTLRNEHFARLVLEIEDPEWTAERINAAVSNQMAPGRTSPDS
jgi:hypothetical protein